MQGCVLPLPPDRDSAIRAGTLRYFTGEPCRVGHISPRRASSGECVECNRASVAKRRASGKETATREKRKEEQMVTGKWQRIRKKALLKFQYGIEIEEYERLLNEQNNCCAICGQPEKIIDHQSGNLRALAVDHCHETNKIRGLLCQACNTALGQFNDDISLLGMAITYLKEKGK